MPNFTAGYPKTCGDIKSDIKALNDWAVALIDELKFVLSNIDECNISESFTESFNNTTE